MEACASEDSHMLAYKRNRGISGFWKSQIKAINLFFIISFSSLFNT